MIIATITIAAMSWTECVCAITPAIMIGLMGIAVILKN